PLTKAVHRAPPPSAGRRRRICGARTSCVEIQDVHGLRHTIASHAVLRGVPLPIVSRLLGNKRLSMTLRYAHVGDREIEAAAEPIGAAIARALNVGATVSIG
ncbi:MAG: tyrosine-type recombinase/integrase, partial [Alphaproteobacteria bacterium]|nr:tyrosine-type recombinase/integrase [Alphaproteobacteria bacterium]